jgi:hypothetical protein
MVLRFFVAAILLLTSGVGCNRSQTSSAQANNLSLEEGEKLAVRRLLQQNQQASNNAQPTAP